MGEEDVVSEKPEFDANGNPEVEGKVVTDLDMKEEQQDGAREMEVDKQEDVKVEAQNMDMGKDVVSKSRENDENAATENGEEKSAADGEKLETEAEEEKQETAEEVEEEEIKNEDLEESAEKETKNAAENKVEEDTNGLNEDEAENQVEEEADGAKEDEAENKVEEADGVKVDEENQDKADVKMDEANQEEPSIERESKKRSRTKSSDGQKKMNKKISKEKVETRPRTPNEKKAKEPKTSSNNMEANTSVGKKDKEPITPVAYAMDRPVRERKSVERLVDVIDKDSAKEFHIAKGRGTELKDIPNVAYKLSRKKTEETLKLLHTVLFARRGKAAEVKTNILRFSGFVWNDNEEKQMIKVKEKLNKCVREKLVEFCDVLDLPISKANTRKEDIVAKLIEFLVEPHATTSELLDDKEQSSKGKKRKRVSKSPGSSTPSKVSAKTPKKTGSASKKRVATKGTPPESEYESGEEREERINGISEKSEDEMSEQAASEEKENESVEDKAKKHGSAKSPTKKRSVDKTKPQKLSVDKAKTQKKMVSEMATPQPKKVRAKSKGSGNSSDKKSSIKKKEESDKKSPALKKSAPMESLGKKFLKVKDKLKEGKLTDDKLRNAICEILKDVDFNTATFTDILKLLAQRFSTDLTPRKSSIKLMIQEELTKLAGEEEDESDAENEKKDSTQVKA